MDFLSSAIHNNNKPTKEEEEQEQQQQHHHHRPPPSSSELLSSAKVVGEAVKSTFSHQTDKVDKNKVANAASDLLGGASHYGKLEEKGYGKYLEKAENYLEKYHHGHGTTEAHKSNHSTTTEAHISDHNTNASKQSTGGDHQESAGGGYGDFLKMAEGFVKKK